MHVVRWIPGWLRTSCNVFLHDGENQRSSHRAPVVLDEQRPMAACWFNHTQHSSLTQFFRRRRGVVKCVWLTPQPNAKTFFAHTRLPRSPRSIGIIGTARVEHERCSTMQTGNLSNRAGGEKVVRKGGEKRKGRGETDRRCRAAVLSPTGTLALSYHTAVYIYSS